MRTGPLSPSREDRAAPGPAAPPAPPRLGALPAVVAAVRLPADLVVTLGYVVRQLPHLVQDLRSIVNDLARLAHEGEPGALSELLAGLARAAAPQGALTHLLRSAGDLAQARAEVEGRRLEEPDHSAGPEA